WHQQRRKCPERRSSRDKRDAVLIPEIQRVYEENYSVYCVRKVWRQLKREGVGVARCTIERLMKALQLRGGTRGKSGRTTRSNKPETPQDRVTRQFVAERPDRLWVADFTYVSTWQGFAYVAF
uniref:IS3 family transposase n=1 Tax=Pantoea brenneri TaxID=472694 RepID=UPI000ABFC5EA